MPKEFQYLDEIFKHFLYREEVTIAAGGAYAGKSRLMLHTAHALALGQPCFLGKLPAPLTIVYCSERSWKLNCHQMRTVGITTLPDNFIFFCVPDLSPMEAPAFERDPLGFLSNRFAQAGITPDLVIFDTVFHFQAQPPTGKDSVNSYSFNKRDLLHMKQWATQHNLAVLGLSHSPKQSEKNAYPDPFDRILGSTAILASTVAVMILERESDDVLKVHLRSHLTKIQDPTRLYNYSDFSPYVPEAELSLGPREIAVLALIPQTPTLYTNMVKIAALQLSISDSQVRNILLALVRKGELTMTVDGVERLLQRAQRVSQ